MESGILVSAASRLYTLIFILKFGHANGELRRQVEFALYSSFLHIVTPQHGFQFLIRRFMRFCTPHAIFVTICYSLKFVSSNRFY